MKNQSRRIRSRAGFTILEVLIASILVGVGIFAILEPFNRGFFGFGEAERYSQALTLSQGKMEDLKGTAFASLTNVSKAALASPYNQFQQQVVVTSINADLKQIVVTTYWNVPGGETSLNLTTYAANT